MRSSFDDRAAVGPAIRPRASVGRQRNKTGAVPVSGPPSFQKGARMHDPETSLSLWVAGVGKDSRGMRYREGNVDPPPPSPGVYLAFNQRGGGGGRSSDARPLISKRPSGFWLADSLGPARCSCATTQEAALGRFSDRMQGVHEAGVSWPPSFSPKIPSWRRRKAQSKLSMAEATARHMAANKYREGQCQQQDGIKAFLDMQGDQAERMTQAISTTLLVKRADLITEGGQARRGAASEGAGTSCFDQEDSR